MLSRRRDASTVANTTIATGFRAAILWRAWFRGSRPCALLVVYLLAISLAPCSLAEEPPAEARPWWKHLVLPFRSAPLPTRTGAGCGIGIVNCLTGSASPPSYTGTPDARKLKGSAEDIVLLRTKADRHGPLGHHWLEVDTSLGVVGFGFGPATIPFIDAGQIGLQDEHGNIERYSGSHPLQPLTLPPLGYDYARAPGEGFETAKPIPITRSQADQIIRRFRKLHRVTPYIPLVNDCRTFVCRVKAKTQGKSTLPCHLLFKGYW